MIDREKVIKGLECCLVQNEEFPPLCEECPYCDEKIGSCEYYRDILSDALALLKAQEPREMTPEEVEDVLDTVVWVDRPQIMNSSSEFALVVGYSRKHEKMDLHFIDGEITTWRYSDYGKTWRCWSSRPTDEQKEAVPWTE